MSLDLGGKSSQAWLLDTSTSLEERQKSRFRKWDSQKWKVHWKLQLETPVSHSPPCPPFTTVVLRTERPYVLRLPLLSGPPPSQFSCFRGAAEFRYSLSCRGNLDVWKIVLESDFSFVYGTVDNNGADPTEAFSSLKIGFCSNLGVTKKFMVSPLLSCQRRHEFQRKLGRNQTQSWKEKINPA